MSSSYWLEEEAPPLPRQTLAKLPHVEVVGGGVTGCTCALVLAREGLRVRLHEAREIASGASGRNGGFALRGGAMAYDVAQEQLGQEGAKAFWRLTEAGLVHLEELAGDAFRRTGSLRLAADRIELDAVRREHDALAADGFSVGWDEALKPPLRGRYPAALVHPTDGALQPARWVRRLARLAAEAGAEIREGSRVSIDELEADQVVIATDGYGSGLLAELDGAIRPTRGQILVTEALPQLLFPQPHYARYGFDYWHQTPDRRLVIGGQRDAALETEYTDEERTTPRIQKRIEQFMVELLSRPPRITHRWSGIFGTTPDLIPLAGRLPGSDRVWLACGYSGHGNVLGLVCGELVAHAVLGRPRDELRLFDPERLLGRG